MRLLRTRSDRGSVEIEIAILAVPLIVLLMFGYGIGRSGDADNQVSNAAYSAARAASLARSESAGHRAAQASAQLSLDNAGRTCASMTTELIDTSGYDSPVGQPGFVTIRVRCVVSFSDLYLPGWPGSKTFSYDFTSPLDQYRARA